MSNSVINFSDRSNKKAEDDAAWLQVTEALNVVNTLIKVQTKSLPRTGKHLHKALNSLFDAIRIYNIVRSKTQ